MVVIRATADVFRFVIDDFCADRLNQRLLFITQRTKNMETLLIGFIVRSMTDCEN